MAHESNKTGKTRKAGKANAPSKPEPAKLEHITHPIPQVFDENSRVLILGTMASPKSREMGFYYGHPQNRFWDVMAAVIGKPCGKSADERRRFVLESNIALADVLAECRIEGASDASIRDPRPQDLGPIFASAHIDTVFTTGTTAAKLYRRYQAPSWPETPHVALPSTSSANARMSLQDLIDAYAPVKRRLAATKPYWVYIVKCADNTLYTGIAADVDKRVAIHNQKKGAKYTRSRTPVKCIYREPQPSKGEALRREREIKRLTRMEKERLVESGAK